MPPNITATPRLAALMDDRRIGLHLEWKDVADRAQISPAHLRKFRKGEAGLSKLAARKVQEALAWAPGSFERVLDGGDPIEVREVSGVAALALTATATTTAHAGAATASEAEGLGDAIRQLARRLSAEQVRSVLEEFIPRDVGGDRRYEDDVDEYLSHTPGLSESELSQVILYVKVMRMHREQAAAEPDAEVHEIKKRQA